MSSDRLPWCGGTDTAAIVCSTLGVPYFGSAWGVWAERYASAAMPPRDPGLQRVLDFGLFVEPWVLKRYAAESEACRGGLTLATGCYPEGASDSSLHTLRDDPAPWMRAQVDGTVWDAGRMVGVVDAKNSGNPAAWFGVEVDDGEVLPRKVEKLSMGYEAQVLQQMALLRAHGHPVEFADIAVQIDVGRPLVIRQVLWDAGQWRWIRGVVGDWWERHIIRGERPADDDSEVCARWRMYCQPRAKGSRVATGPETAAVLGWVSARSRRAQAEAEEAAARGAVLAAMDTERLMMPGEATTAPYVQLQAGPKGSKVLRTYRFVDPTTTEQE